MLPRASGAAHRRIGDAQALYAIASANGRNAMHFEGARRDADGSISCLQTRTRPLVRRSEAAALTRASAALRRSRCPSGRAELSEDIIAVSPWHQGFAPRSGRNSRAPGSCADKTGLADAFKVLRLMVSHTVPPDIKVATTSAADDGAAAAWEFALVMEAHRALEYLCRWEAQARGHFDRALGHYASDRHPSYVLFTGHDPKVVSECARARALWALGYPDRALEGVTSALALAQQLSHVQSVVSAAYYAAHLHLLRGEPALSQPQARQPSSVRRHGLEFVCCCRADHHASCGGAGERGKVTSCPRDLPCTRHGARVCRTLFLVCSPSVGEDKLLDDAWRSHEILTLARSTESYISRRIAPHQGRAIRATECEAIGAAEACFQSPRHRTAPGGAILGLES